MRRIVTSVLVSMLFLFLTPTAAQAVVNYSCTVDVGQVARGYVGIEKVATQTASRKRVVHYSAVKYVFYDRPLWAKFRFHHAYIPSLHRTFTSAQLPTHRSDYNLRRTTIFYYTVEHNFWFGENVSCTVVA